MHDAALAPSPPLSSWHLPLLPPAARRPITIVVTCGTASPSQPYHRRSRWWSKATVTIRVTVVRPPGPGPSPASPPPTRLGHLLFSAAGVCTSAAVAAALISPTSLAFVRRRRRFCRRRWPGPSGSVQHAAVACCGRTGQTPPQLHPRQCYTGKDSDQPPPSQAAASRRLLRPGRPACFHTSSPHVTVTQACTLVWYGW